jgi:hypothetical protein
LAFELHIGVSSYVDYDRKPQSFKAYERSHLRALSRGFAPSRES